MGLCNSPDIFQAEINKMFCGFEFIQSNIDLLLLITKNYWSNHLIKVKLTLKNLKDSMRKCNNKKSFFEKPIWNIWVSG